MKHLHKPVFMWYMCRYCSRFFEDCVFFFCQQEALITVKAEALHWQSLYEELKLSSGQLRENQHLSNEQLQQLHSQVEVWYTVTMCTVSSVNVDKHECRVQLSRAREDELREEVVSLRQEKQELQYNIRLLEEDNHTLREENQHLRGKI